MTTDEIYAELAALLQADDFAVKQGLSPATRFAEIDGWDSFKHLRLVLEVEERFGFELSPEQGERVETLADLVQIAAQR